MKKEKLTEMEKKVRKDIKETRAKGGLKYMVKEDAAKYGDWAKAQLKDDRITIRVSGEDKRALMTLAAAQGLKYQTYLGNLIHRAAAKLVKA